MAVAVCPSRDTTMLPWIASSATRRGAGTPPPHLVVLGKAVAGHVDVHL